MIITKMSLPRRTFLRGMGVTLALPLLDAMVPALTASAKTPAASPQRLGFVYVPNGVNTTTWAPAGEGTTFDFSRALAPLEAYRDQLVILSQLSSFPAEAQGDGGGDHARAAACWLSGVHPRKTQGGDVRGGKTADQLAADELGKDTQFPSLQLAVDNIEKIGSCDGYACTYVNTLSWRTPTTPLPMQNNPRVVFERLFGDGGSHEERRALRQAQRSILDSISESAVRLQNRLGRNDRDRMDQYLDGIRETEQRIEKIEQQGDIVLSAAELPIGIPDLFDDHVKLMFDLQVLAYQADISRVITFLMCREVSQRAYVNIGVPDPHHGLSHHGDDPVVLEKLSKIDTYHAQLFSYYLERLKATPDGDGSLLDHSLITYGSCISDGNTHSHRNLPTVLAGGGGGQVKGGRHILYPEDTPHSNLLVTLLDKVGVKVDGIGDSVGRLSEV